MKAKNMNRPSAFLIHSVFMIKRFWQVAALGAILSACSSPTPTAQTTSPPTTGTKDFTVGLVIVGPKNDGGWNQAHYEGMEQVAKNLGIKLEYVDKVNPGDRPNVTGAQVADDLISKGAPHLASSRA